MTKTNQNWKSLVNYLSVKGKYYWMGIENINSVCSSGQDCGFTWVDGTPFQYNENVNNEISFLYNNNDNIEKYGTYLMNIIRDSNEHFYHRPVCQKCTRGNCWKFEPFTYILLIFIQQFR